MLWNLILGGIAGYLTPMAEPHVKKALENIAQAEIPVGKTEYDMLTLIVMLMAASALVALLGGDSMAFLLLLGALAGLFGKRIYQVIVAPRVASSPGTGQPYSAPRAHEDPGAAADDAPSANTADTGGATLRPAHDPSPERAAEPAPAPDPTAPPARKPRKRGGTA